MSLPSRLRTLPLPASSLLVFFALAACSSDPAPAADGGSAADVPVDTGGSMDVPTDGGSTVDVPADTGSAVDVPGDTGSAADVPGDTGSAADVPGDVGTLPGRGQPCPENKCAEGLSCIEYFGIAGPSGPRFTSCETRCGAEPMVCPDGLRCVTIADGPGRVCRPGA